jgi:hypothetical protein
MNKLIIIFGAVFLLFSCNPDDTPPTMNFQFETSGSTNVMGDFGWCCKVAGTTCSKAGSGFVSMLPILRPYIQNDNISGFFQRPDWQQLLPQISVATANLIIAQNLKGAILNNNTIIILKDRNKGYEAENVLAAVKHAPSPDCDKILGGN